MSRPGVGAPRWPLRCRHAAGATVALQARGVQQCYLQATLPRGLLVPASAREATAVLLTAANTVRASTLLRGTPQRNTWRASAASRA